MASVHFRLSESMKSELEWRAGSKTLSRYMIEMMERDWQRSDRYDDILAALDDLRASQRNRESGEDGHGVPPGWMAEVLLLLRSMAGPAAQRSAQTEVKRTGIDVWGLDLLEGDNE